MWQFWVDRGGTFTDCVGRDPRDGRLHVVKVPSSDAAPIVAIRRILGVPEGPLPPCQVVLATTLGTNALLQRRGAATALVVTKGFADLLTIGDQTRPSLFTYHVVKDPLAPAETLETELRLDRDGNVVRELDWPALAARLVAARDRGVGSVAVSILNAHRRPEVEHELAERIRALGLRHVTEASLVGGEIGYLARTETALVDAYLTPLLEDYLRGVDDELSSPPGRGSRLWVMQSSGTLTRAQSFRGRDCLVSGPAAGVLAVAQLARRHGLSAAIGLDIGGTSADVCFVHGAAGALDETMAQSREYESRVAGSRVRAPMLPLHTIAAGGGSICRWDGLRLMVGPRSAGARPGPLCYGDPAATELTLSDVSLVLGQLATDRFLLPLDEQRPARALEAMAGALREQGVVIGDGSARALALGFRAIGDAAMAEAISRITIERGRDPRDAALVAFGGAGGLHACAVARRLGIRTILAPAHAGVLAATGLAAGLRGWHGHRDGGRRPLSASAAQLDQQVAELDAEFAALEREVLGDAAPTSPTRRRMLDLRYRGSDHAITIELPEAGGAAARVAAALTAFGAAHRAMFGYERSAEVEVAALRVELTAPLPDSTPLLDEAAPAGGAAAVARRHQTMWTEGGVVQAAVYYREALACGAEVAGPAIVVDETTAVVVEEGFVARVLFDGALLLSDREREAGAALHGAASAEPDPVRLEVYGGLFMSVAEQMGSALRRTAVSTNIRERLDFSCAVFDATGGLVANAPHIPVHLGAMSETVRSLLAEHPSLPPGTVYACNDPSAGGSHLPDITVVTPVHDDRGVLRFFTASRGHHVDVGGITPGSMPPFSRTLLEEGVVLRHVPIVRDGAFAEETLRALLAAGPYPARRIDDNLADLAAQVAANRLGAQLLSARLAQEGERLARYMGYVQAHAAALVTRAIETLPLPDSAPGNGRARDATAHQSDQLDDGSVIAVTITRHGGRLCIDFSGTSVAHPGNLNAPRAVTVAAVIYVLRCLVGAPIPLNSGCLAPVELVIPPGSLLDPPPGVAVCGGNVETSQRVVDVLLGALELAAASQGTMNNLTLGNRGFAYYETICGGAGATALGPGASAVHTHMTNTRITDPEVLEARFPLRLVRFAIRRGSGGAGQLHGGDGVIRELELLEPMEISILSQRRAQRPFGLRGGGAGAAGRNWLGGTELPGAANVRAPAGAILRIETPGGGGFGTAGGRRDGSG